MVRWRELCKKKRLTVDRATRPCLNSNRFAQLTTERVAAMMSSSRMLGGVALVLCVVVLCSYASRRLSAQSFNEKCYTGVKCSGTVSGAYTDGGGAQGKCNCKLDPMQVNTVTTCVLVQLYSCTSVFESANICGGTCTVRGVVVDCSAILPGCIP